MELARLDPADIEVGAGRRPAAPDKVAALAASMKEIGLQTPISVWVPPGNESVHLVAGRHRLEAAKLLGWPRIECIVVNLDERERRMWEIAENLHRAELTVLERADSVAEWIRLAEEKEADILRQVDAKLGRPEGGRRAAAREIGIPEPSARRAEAVANLQPEAKKEARALHLDNNQTALLRAAREKTPEAQVEALQRHANPDATAITAMPTPPPSAVVLRQVEAIMTAWGAAGHEARDLFLERAKLTQRR